MSQQSLSVVGCCILELLSSSTTLSYSRPCSRHGPRDSVAHPQTTNDDADSTEAPQDPQGGALGARKVSLRRVHPSSSASHVDRRERFELLQTIQCCYDSGSNQLLAAYRINRPHSPPEAFVRSPTASRMTLITDYGGFDGRGEAVAHQVYTLVQSLRVLLARLLDFFRGCSVPLTSWFHEPRHLDFRSTRAA